MLKVITMFNILYKPRFDRLIPLLGIIKQYKSVKIKNILKYHVLDNNKRKITQKPIITKILKYKY